MIQMMKIIQNIRKKNIKNQSQDLDHMTENRNHIKSIISIDYSVDLKEETD